MIVIIDYGAGNLFSVQNALGYLGFENKISRDENEVGGFPLQDGQNSPVWMIVEIRHHSGLEPNTGGR